MKAQRFTITIKAKRTDASQFTLEEISEALQMRYPGTFDEKYGSHTYTVKEAR